MLRIALTLLLLFYIRRHVSCPVTEQIGAFVATGEGGVDSSPALPQLISCFFSLPKLYRPGPGPPLDRRVYEFLERRRVTRR